MIKHKGAAMLFFAFAAPVMAAHAGALPDEYMKVAISGGRHPVVDIATNLPENMDISVDINPVGGGFDAGDTYQVHNGHIHVGPISDNGNAVAAGPYNLLITCPVAQFQTDPKVQELMGDDGRNLSGPDVKESEMGAGRVIDIRRTFTVN